VINIMDALKKNVKLQGDGAPPCKLGAAASAKKTARAQPKRKSA
jgi:hypothetical protein